jgi:quercetin dioxygenase-like cupin family protein
MAQTSSAERIFQSDRHFTPSSTGEPVRSVVVETSEVVVVAWHVEPGERIPAHVHPLGQDTWTILAGQGAYQVSADGTSRSIVAGDVVVARTGDVHGVFNDGSVPLRFISVVAPAGAGYELLG